MNRFVIGLCAVLLFLTPGAEATEQIPDVLVVRSKTKCVYCSIGDAFLKRLDRWKKQMGYILECTANRKGYLAEWRIEADKLYLQDVTVGVLAPVTVPAKKVFGKATPIHTDWVTGEVAELSKPWLGFIPWIKTEKVYLFEKGILKKTFRRKARW